MPKGTIATMLLTLKAPSRKLFGILKNYFFHHVMVYCLIVKSLDFFSTFIVIAFRINCIETIHYAIHLIL